VLNRKRKKEGTNKERRQKGRSWKEIRKIYKQERRKKEKR
jgi:hypothetical protein